MASSAGGGAGRCPRATGWSGCARPTGCHTGPACKICDRCGDRGGKAPDPESGARRPQIQPSEPATEARPAYVNWYINGYRRRWTSSDPNPTMRPDHGRIAGSCGVLPVTTDYMVDQLWGPRGALQRRAEVRTHENYREVFPLLSASFHGRSRDRCGPRERSPRSMRARWLNQAYSGDRKLFPRVRNRCRIRIVRQRSSTRLFSTVPWYLGFSSFLGDGAVQSRP